MRAKKVLFSLSIVVNLLLVIAFFKLAGVKNKQPTVAKSFGQQHEALSRDGFHSQLLAYSAYLDDRLPKNVYARILIYKHSSMSMEDLFCHFKDRSQSVVKGETRRMHEWAPSGQFLWESHWLSCDLPDGTYDSTDWPSSVRVSSKSDSPLDASPLNLTRTSRVPGPKPRMEACCIRNMFNTSQMNANFVLESLYTNVNLGIDTVFIYYSEVLNGPVAKLMQSLMDRPLQSTRSNKQFLQVRLIPYFLPEPDKVYSFSQSLLTNDCLLRAASQFTYVHFRDFDEIFVPDASHPTMQSSIDDYFHGNPSYSLMCFDNWLISVSDEMIANGSSVMRNSHQMTRVPVSKASKCVVKPGEVLEMHIHQAWQLVDSKKCGLFGCPLQPLVSPTKFGRMLHFRRVTQEYPDAFPVALSQVILNRDHVRFTPTREQMLERMKLLPWKWIPKI